MERYDTAASGFTGDRLGELLAAAAEGD